MKKKKKYIALTILFVILISIAAVLFWQRNNLTAIVQAVSYTPEELEVKLAENDTAIEAAVQSVPELQVRPVTEEEKAKLQTGEISFEQLAEQIVVIPAETTPASSQSNTPAPTPAPDPYAQKLSAIIAEVFVLREEYIIELEKIEEAAKKEYFAIPKAQRTSGNLASLGSKYISVASTLEKECDARMDELIDRLRSLVNEYDGDKSIISQVQNNYAQGKSLKKAWYLSKLKEKGIR